MATTANAVAVRGRFVWYDLQTPDMQGAIEFYTKLFGWGTTPFDTPGGHPYTMWTLNGAPMGGVMLTPEKGQPAFWLAYVATPDVDATARDATRLGAKMIVPPKDIPSVGRFAIFEDPHGPAIAAFTASGEFPGHEGNPNVGEFGWAELATTDYEAAFTFYHTLFGWDRGASAPMGEPYGTYQMFARNGITIGGMYNKPAQMPAPPHWVQYVYVADVDQTAARAAALGGQVVWGPTTVSNGPRIAMFTDPQGAMVAIYR
jgi:uncharacterized protein